MIKVAFFGHDAGDAAVRRRVRAMQDGGVSIIGFMMRRQDSVAPEWDNIDLGQTRDGAFVQRVMRIFSGARVAARSGNMLATADVIYARNLDMLACAFLTKRYVKLDTPVIYESLDVHRLLTRTDLIGTLFRAAERSLLRRTIGLVVSSPGFLRNHFEKHYPGLYEPYLVENRLAAASEFGPRPGTVDSAQSSSGSDTRLRLGWVGNLRCRRSFALLCKLADYYPDEIEIRLHGQPARTEIPVFESEIDARANMSFAGRYRSPEDLAAIYDKLDVVWAGDFMEAGYNSTWLLPNRIYEGGYYATPAIAPAGTETAAWINRHDCGLSVEEPLDETLPELFDAILNDRGRLAACRRRLLEMPDEVFIEPSGFFAEVLERALVKARSK
ncbi:glycosyl transferase [Hyphomonas sp.]|uniref:glycosyl transferase n=1 Tax=Hyphomonas sp. TaxID=87 RepID=UPI0032ECAC60